MLEAEEENYATLASTKPKVFRWPIWPIFCPIPSGTDPMAQLTEACGTHHVTAALASALASVMGHVTARLQALLTEHFSCILRRAQ